ncbi:uncharacterized protein VTP21DRAFT_11619 [Calcarisporiella thermophila]|uniref:uncharacterized protein n=1 Tax=Calcarisporiella thermophila TaxID=911321 RepID=UPI0037431677
MPHLPDLTKRLLREEMEKSISKSDQPGFIYAYFLVEDPSIAHHSGTQQHVFFKIGRASNPHRRMQEWQKQCLFRAYLIETIPPTPPPSDSTDASLSDLPRCKYVKRAERLIHIELDSYRSSLTQCSNCRRVHREFFRVARKSPAPPAVWRVPGQIEAMGFDAKSYEEVRSVIMRWVWFIEAIYGKA